jgi:hypothetical protein
LHIGDRSTIDAGSLVLNLIASGYVDRWQLDSGIRSGAIFADG